MRDEKKTAFEASGEERNVSLLGEFFGMVKHNKKYWLIPLVLILFLALVSADCFVRKRQGLA